MITYIVLLRGINVGGNNILPMKELVKILEGIGCTNIRTYIQSGNVVVESNKKKDQLSRDIKSKILKVKDIEIDPIDKEKHDWIAISMGAFDTPTETKLGFHIFVAEKGDYYEITDGLPQNDY